MHSESVIMQQSKKQKALTCEITIRKEERQRLLLHFNHDHCPIVDMELVYLYLR